MLTRRQFSKLLAASPLAASAALSRAEAEPPTPMQDMGAALTQSRDLLIKGGTVIDPSQNLHTQLDVAVKDGKILQVAPDIPADGSRTLIPAKGRIVTPGLIDVHVHVFEGVGPTGVNADQYCLGRGVTTAVDAGSAGYFSIAGLRQYVIKPSATRLYAMIDIGARGTLMGLAGNYFNLDWLNPQLTARAADANKPDVVAIKVRLSKEITGSNDLEALKRALEAAEISNLPVMVHVGDSFSPLPDILRQLRKGDILTHCFTGRPHGPLDANGKILPEMLECRERGVLFDVGDGGPHLSLDVAEKCLQQNFLPDTIGTDLGGLSINGPVYDLVTELSKFLTIGMTLDQVIERVTLRPTRMFNFGVEIGTLRPGSVADITILNVREGSFVFGDSTGKKRTGKQKLQSVAAIRAGKAYINRSDDVAKRESNRAMKQPG
ncbi:MAG TPA: amidohydrolase/deacetylase family metallohydrolase [Verrucomicrobiae bacterium]|jgi:dihydroorotase|nr:amidohydrolase/deacetylase family metallohydrolase [Verrucomicrobiae bacterium]